MAPSKYLQRLQDHVQVQINDAEMDRILQSHCIPAQQLRTDDFDDFYRQRKQSLLNLISSVMGKKVVSESLEGKSIVEDEEL
jgi:hypothetical protein